MKTVGVPQDGEHPPVTSCFECGAQEPQSDSYTGEKGRWWRSSDTHVFCGMGCGVRYGLRLAKEGKL